MPVETDQTVDRILDAAIEEFLLIGIRRATIGSVAQRAGVGPATIYRRVGQRDQLVTAAVTREIQRCLVEIAAAVAPYEGLDDRITETFVAVLRIVFRHPLLERMRQIEPDALARQVTVDAGPPLELARTFIRAECERSNALGQTDVKDVDAYADVVARFMHSVLITPPEDILDDEDRARAYAHAAITPLLR